MIKLIGTTGALHSLNTYSIFLPIRIEYSDINKVNTQVNTTFILEYSGINKVNKTFKECTACLSLSFSLCFSHSCLAAGAVGGFGSQTQSDAGTDSGL